MTIFSVVRSLAMRVVGGSFGKGLLNTLKGAMTVVRRKISVGGVVKDLVVFSGVDWVLQSLFSSNSKDGGSLSYLSGIRALDSTLDRSLPFVDLCKRAALVIKNYPDDHPYKQSTHFPVFSCLLGLAIGEAQRLIDSKLIDLGDLVSTSDPRSARGVVRLLDAATTDRTSVPTQTSFDAIAYGETALSLIEGEFLDVPAEDVYNALANVVSSIQNATGTYEEEVVDLEDPSSSNNDERSAIVQEVAAYAEQNWSPVERLLVTNYFEKITLFK